VKIAPRNLTRTHERKIKRNRYTEDETNIETYYTSYVKRKMETKGKKKEPNRCLSYLLERQRAEREGERNIKKKKRKQKETGQLYISKLIIIMFFFCFLFLTFTNEERTPHHT
jgi:hypothetical protein